MHIYIYDSYLNDKKYESSLAKIETRLTDLGLNGKIIRLGTISSIQDTIKEEIKRGAKTFIAVGNIKILNQVTSSMAKFFQNNQIGNTVPLGFIPVGKTQNEFSIKLGIDLEEGACDFLAARRIKIIGLGQVNQEYFLTQAKITTMKTLLEIDANYSIEIKKEGEIFINNLSLYHYSQPDILSDINDNILELTIKNNKLALFKSNNVNNSVFPFSKLIISNPDKKLLIDNCVEITMPATITVAQEKINLIVGKNR